MHPTHPPREAVLSNTAAAVLGMVALGARSGYEIRRAAERSVRFFWALGPPQIYAELKRLEAGALVAGSDDARGDRPRRVFEITAAGRDALHAWLTADDAAPLELRDAELLRLFFTDVVGRDEGVARVRVMRERSLRAVAQFEREIEPAAERTREAGHVYPALVAEFGREMHEFIAGWCDRLEAQLGERGGDR